MRIMIDLTRSPYSGIGRYSWELYKKLINCDNNNTYYGLVFSGWQSHGIELSNVFEINSFPQTFEDIIDFSRKIESLCDLFIATNFSTLHLIEKIPVIQVVHDYIYLKHPEWQPTMNDLNIKHGEFLSKTINNEFLPYIEEFLFDKNDNFIYVNEDEEKTKVNRIFKGVFSYYTYKAAGIIAISKSVKKDVDFFFPDLKKPTEVLYNAIPKYLSRGRISKKIKKNELSLLYVANYEPRKNHAVLIDVIEILEKEYGLMVSPTFVGRMHYKSHYDRFLKKLEKFNNSSSTKITMKSNISDIELSMLYRNSDIFTYPTLDEGFGIPLIEAMKFQLPTVATEIETTKEIGGDSILFSKNKSPESFAEAIIDLTSSYQIKNRLVENQAKRYEELLENDRMDFPIINKLL